MLSAISNGRLRKKNPFHFSTASSLRQAGVSSALQSIDCARMTPFSAGKKSDLVCVTGNRALSTDYTKEPVLVLRALVRDLNAFELIVLKSLIFHGLAVETLVSLLG